MSFRCVLMIEVEDKDGPRARFVGRAIELPYLPERGTFLAGHGRPGSGAFDVVMARVWVVSTGLHFIYLGAIDDDIDSHETPRPRTPDEVGRIYGDEWKDMVPGGTEGAPQWAGRCVR